MKYKRRNLIFLKVCDSNFSHPGLCLKSTGEIVNFAGLARLAAVSFGEYRSFKPPNSLVINDDLSRLKCDELQS